MSGGDKERRTKRKVKENSSESLDAISASKSYKKSEILDFSALSFSHADRIYFVAKKSQ